MTVYGSDGANDVYTLNFSTEKSGSGNLQDFAYLTFGEADETFEPTSETNIYKDLEGSGDFRFEVVDPQGGFPITDNDHGTVTGGGIAPKHLDGKRIKFTYEESMVIEFTDKDAYEVFGETERSEAMSYDADTEGDKVKVTVYGSDGANDVYRKTSMFFFIAGRVVSCKKVQVRLKKPYHDLFHNVCNVKKLMG